MKDPVDRGGAETAGSPLVGWALAIGVVALVVTYLTLNWPAIVDPVVGIVEVLLR